MAKPGSLKIEMVAIADIAPYANNAKVHPDAQVAQIRASIEQFGFVNPVLLDGAGNLIAGHGRLEAAEALGMLKVPAIRLGYLTDDQVKALRIADNSIPESGTSWNPELLELELASLRAVKFDLEPLGLEHIEIADIEEPVVPPPKPQRNKTTIFVSVLNADVTKARKAIVAALDKAKVGHNL